MSWTDERIKMLKKLWTDGLSASQIANKMGGLSRNAVIGKVHRLGLSGRATPTQVSMARVGSGRDYRGADGRQHGRGGRRGLPKDFDMMAEPALTPEQRASVLHLTEHRCKWPIGDPGTTAFHFCGARSKTGSPYCSTHAAQAYQPLERRRRKSQAG